MYCSNCGMACTGAKFCSRCGLMTAAMPSVPAKKPTFWQRLTNAVAMQAEIEMRAATSHYSGIGRASTNPDGTWSYVNDAAGSSFIGDGQHIEFTK